MYVFLVTRCLQSVSRAKAEVHKFAKEVIQWVSDVGLAFRSRKNGHFIRRTKRNLMQMRYVSATLSL